MQKGFFGALFDISFTTLVTTKIVKFFYAFSLVLIGLIALGWVIVAFEASTALGVITLVIVAPLVALWYAIWARVVFEFIIAVFRLVEINAELVALKRQQLGLPIDGAAEPQPSGT